VHGVHVNILMTEGIRVGKCRAGGTMTDDGWWSERPTPEAIGDEDEHESWKDYWGPGGESAAMTLPAGSSVLYFKLNISEPGKYRFRVKLWGGDLPAAITEDAFLVVGTTEEQGSEHVQRLAEDLDPLVAGRGMLILRSVL
jgi:hypothetical protein